MEGALALIGFPARRSLIRFLKPLELRVPAKTLQPMNSIALENRVKRGGRFIVGEKMNPSTPLTNATFSVVTANSAGGTTLLHFFRLGDAGDGGKILPLPSSASWWAMW
jgi:hypothetical protein